jgi:four helix bundle protein
VGRVERFEDLLAWQHAMELVTQAYRVSRQRPFSRDFALCDQLHRAAISVPANIAEGFERNSRAEFHRFLTIAKGSCGEVRTHVMIAHRLEYLDEEAANTMIYAAEETSRLISRLRTSVARQRDAAPKKAKPL